MKPSDTWRLAERLLYNYTTNLTCRELLIIDYNLIRAHGDIKAQAYTENYNKRRRDAVAEHYERLSSIHSKIRRLERKIMPVKRLIHKLNYPSSDDDKELYHELQDVMLYIYFGHNTMRATAIYLNKSISSLQRRKKRLVRMLIPEAEQMNEIC